MSNEKKLEVYVAPQNRLRTFPCLVRTEKVLVESARAKY